MRAEYGQQPWNDAVEDMVAQIESPEYAAEAPPALGGSQEVRDDSLASIAEMGFTVREVG